VVLLEKVGMAALFSSAFWDSTSLTSTGARTGNLQHDSYDLNTMQGR
jgi:hypothetical protein